MTINRLYFFLTFLVIAISGNPAMGILGKETIYIGTLMIFVVVWLFKPLKLTRQDVQVFVLFALLTLMHFLNFGTMVIAASLGFLIKLVIALLAVKLIPEFSRRYVSAMYVLSLISLALSVPSVLGVDMESLFSTVRLPIGSNIYHIGVYNFHISPDAAIRNAGMFWEPGAFAGYLILALFILIRDGQRNAVFTKQGLVLIAALLTTQSTTGYLAFMVLAVFYVFNAGLIKTKAASLLTASVLMVVLAVSAYIAMGEVSFLGEKINAQFEAAVDRTDASRINRFGNFLYDLEWITERPVLGWSATPATRLTSDQKVAELIAGQGNGLTGFTVKFGLVGLLMFFGFLAFTTHRITGSLSTSLFSIAIVFALLNGEQFLGFPMFFTLLFVPREKLTSLTGSRIVNVRKIKFDIQGIRGR